ncbi:MAG TPA: hypothetical protein VIS29_16450 [Streptomyces sp.]|jgi:hypothetical protein
MTPDEREQLLASRAAFDRNQVALAPDLWLARFVADEFRKALPDISTLDLGRAVNVAAGISGVIAGDPYGRVPTVLLAAALDLLGPELGPPD